MQKKTTRFPPDRTLLIVGLLVGLLTTGSIVLPYCTGELNTFLKYAVTAPVGYLLITLPLIMHWSLNIQQEHRELEACRTQEKLRKRQRGKVRFRCFFSSDEDGTSWLLTNRNNFQWTNAYLLVERCFEGHKESEKIALGDIAAGATVGAEANLVDISRCRWRAMIVCLEGQALDFPERPLINPWLRSDEAL